ncbi:MAG: hypothetical protein E6Q76_18220 [Rhizobium sp.]|nr:MAG: hypothetical protein E6Q76_18220 [Rhizobium sp.]
MSTHLAGAADLAPAIAPQPEPGTPGWTFTFAPYFWAAGISGKTANFGLPTVDVHENFGDILSDIDFGFMAAGDARYDRYSIMTDINYARVTTDAATPRGVVASRVGLKTETFSAFLGGGYSIIDDPAGRLDVIGGIKFWSVETKVDFRGGLLSGVSRSDSATWVDGLVGLRGMYSITPKIYLTTWGLIGTGGADIDWDALAGIGYKFNDRVSAIIGYRALGVNYSDDHLTYNVVEHGPILGFAVHF